jgi:hypothetical protein
MKKKTIKLRKELHLLVLKLQSRINGLRVGLDYQVQLNTKVKQLAKRKIS